MKWSYWISLYIRTHSVARGLRPLSLADYEEKRARERDRKSTRLNSSHRALSRMPSSA